MKRNKNGLLFEQINKISKVISTLSEMYDLLEDHTNSEYFEENKGVNVLSPMVA